MPSTTAKRPRGRPPTGRTPDKDRTAKSREDLANTGGKRLDIRLTAQGAEDLAITMIDSGLTQTEAVHRALRFYVESM